MSLLLLIHSADSLHEPIEISQHSAKTLYFFYYTPVECSAIEHVDLV